jgi:hypothetical protein
MKRGLLFMLFGALVAGCGSNELDPNVIREAKREAIQDIEAMHASYGEPSGCRRLPVTALPALHPKYGAQASERESDEFVKHYSLVRGEPLTGGPPDLARATFYASFAPIDGPLGAKALSGQALRTGHGSVLKEKEYEALSDTALEDANRARACALAKEK